MCSACQDYHRRRSAFGTIALTSAAPQASDLWDANPKIAALFPANAMDYDGCRTIGRATSAPSTQVSQQCFNTLHPCNIPLDVASIL